MLANGCKCEKFSSLSKGADKDLKKGKDDFDGNIPPVVFGDESPTAATSNINIDSPCSVGSKSGCRI